MSEARNHFTVIKGKLFFKDRKVTSTILISNLFGNSVISSSYYYKYLNSTELIYTNIQKPLSAYHKQNWRSFIAIKHHCRMQIYCSLLLEKAKWNAEYPADNQPQNESVFFIWHTSVSVPEPIHCWSLCENLLPLFIYHHKHQTLSTNIYRPANLAPVIWIVFSCHEQVQQFIPVHDLVVKCNSKTRCVGVWWWSNVLHKGQWKAIIKTKSSTILVWHHQSLIICTHKKHRFFEWYFEAV